MKYRTLFMLLISLSAQPAFASDEPLIPLCVTGTDTRCGLIDREGIWRVPPGYKDIVFADDIWLAKRKIPGSSDNPIDILNYQGEITTTFRKVKKIGDGILLATNKQNDLYYLYNYDGQQISATGVKWAMSFAEGLAAAQESKTGKWGYINQKGEWVIPPRYEEARTFSFGLAAVKTAKMKWNFPEDILIDTTGKVFKPFKPGYSYMPLNEKYLQVRHTIVDPDNEFERIVDRAEIINRQGQVVKRNINIFRAPENDIAGYEIPQKKGQDYGTINTRTLKIITPYGSPSANNIARDKLTEFTANLNKTLTSPLTDHPLFLTNPWQGYDATRRGNFIYNIQALPSLMWLGTSQAETNEYVLSTPDGHEVLRTVQTAQISEMKCDHAITLVQRESKILWPENPAALCEATRHDLDKYSPAAQAILLKQEEDDRSNELKYAQTDTLPWQEGPRDITVSGIATFHLPAGYRFLPVENAPELNQKESLLIELKRGDNSRAIGFISPQQGWWRATLWFDKHAPVNTSKLDNMDLDNLLSTMKTRINPDLGEQIKMQMYTELSPKWTVEPVWDRSQQRLSWAVEVDAISSSDSLVKTLKLGNQWLAQVMLTNSAMSYSYPQHTRPQVILGELNKLIDQVKFSPGEEFKPGAVSNGLDATMFITGLPTRDEVAISNYFEREAWEREERSTKTLRDGLLRILPILIPALLIGSGGLIASRKKSQKYQALKEAFIMAYLADREKHDNDKTLRDIFTQLVDDKLEARDLAKLDALIKSMQAPKPH